MDSDASPSERSDGDEGNETPEMGFRDVLDILSAASYVILRLINDIQVLCPYCNPPVSIDAEVALGDEQITSRPKASSGNE